MIFHLFSFLFVFFFLSRFFIPPCSFSHSFTNVQFLPSFLSFTLYFFSLIFFHFLFLYFLPSFSFNSYVSLFYSCVFYTFYIYLFFPSFFLCNLPNSWMKIIVDSIVKLNFILYSSCLIQLDKCFLKTKRGMVNRQFLKYLFLFFFNRWFSPSGHHRNPSIVQRSNSRLEYCNSNIYFCLMLKTWNYFFLIWGI